MQFEHGAKRKTAVGPQKMFMLIAPWEPGYVAAINGMHGPPLQRHALHVYQLPVDQKGRVVVKRTLSFHSRLTLYR